MDTQNAQIFIARRIAKELRSGMLVNLGIGIPTTVWFIVGGVIDIRGLLRALSTAVRDHTDDGRVKHEPQPEVLAEEPEPAAAVQE